MIRMHVECVLGLLFGPVGQGKNFTGDEVKQRLNRGEHGSETDVPAHVSHVDISEHCICKVGHGSDHEKDECKNTSQRRHGP